MEAEQTEQENQEGERSREDMKKSAGNAGIRYGSFVYRIRKGFKRKFEKRELLRTQT